LQTYMEGSFLPISWTSEIQFCYPLMRCAVQCSRVLLGSTLRFVRLQPNFYYLKVNALCSSLLRCREQVSSEIQYKQRKTIVKNEWTKIHETLNSLISDINCLPC
jgi:hypothetical protein